MPKIPEKKNNRLTFSCKWNIFKSHTYFGDRKKKEGAVLT